jgi:hypothetical protein
MKKITTSILLLLCLNSYSQNQKTEHENFKLLESKKIIWQKVFDFKGEKDSIVNVLKGFVKQNSFINSLQYKDYTFIGFSNYTKLTNLSGAPMGAYTEYNSFITIDIKDNRYRITIKDIKFKPVQMNLDIISINQSYTLSDFVVRKNHHEIRKNKNSRKFLKNFNKDLIKMLQYSAIKKDDW